MTKTPTNIVTATILAAALTVSLAACSTERMFPPIAGGPTSTPEPTVEPVLDPLDLDGNGSVSEREKEIAAKNAPRDFVMADGTVVQVDPTQPLPEVVREAARAKFTPSVEAGRHSHHYEVTGPHHDSIRATVEDYAARTGRGMTVVFQVTSAGEGYRWVMYASGHRISPHQAEADKATFVTKVEGWAAARNYEFIVID